MGRERLVGGGMAAGALVVVVLVAGAADVGGRPLALAGGVAGAIVGELALQRRQAAVRAAWARPTVKAATTVAFLVAVALSVVVAPSVGLSVLAGGLVGYLALLAGVTVGRTLVT